MMRHLLVLSVVLILAACLYRGDLDFALLDRLKLVLAAAVAALVALRHRGAGRLGQHRNYLRALGLTAAISWVVYLNFGSFHGARTWLHIHDVAHYYLGSKYFDELGYSRMYTAMLRAEAEVYQDHFKSLEARDLENNGLYDIRALLVRSGPVKARFTPERWNDFCADVAYFREAMGSQYGEILRDHGFNPTPFWALLGGSLAKLVPAGSATGILLLSLIDPVLEAALFGMVLWAFGLEMTLLAMLYFTLIFGASFGWTGGAFLRYLWLLGTVGAVCCLHRQRDAAAGALLALATVLRVFPAAFAGMLVLRRAGRFTVGYVVTLALLLGSTLAVPGGWGRWLEFRDNMQRHMQNTAYNTVGLTQILAFDGSQEPTTPETFDAALQRRERLHRWQLWTAFPLALGFALWRSRRGDTVSAVALAPLILFTGLDLAAYYYVLLLVPLLAARRHRPLLAAMFAVEAVVYALRLVEDRQQVLYLYRNLLVACLLAVLYLPPRRRPVSGLRGAPAPPA